MIAFLLVTVWGVGLLVAAVMAVAFRPFKQFNMPRDIERLAAGADRWTRLHWPTESESLVDATVLPDGRVAASHITTFHPEESRPSDVWDPKTGRWALECVVVPERARPSISIPHEPPTRWASLGDGRALLVQQSGAGASVAIEPGGRILPPLEAFPDDIAAAELASGAVLLLTARGKERAALRLEPGGGGWQRLAPPPLGLERTELLAGSGDRAILTGLGTVALFAAGVWRELPPLHEPRSFPIALALEDGSVVVAGGLLMENQNRLRPKKLFGKLAGALGVVGLLALAVRAMLGASPPPIAAILPGLIVAFGLVPAAAYKLIKLTAWH